MSRQCAALTCPLLPPGTTLAHCAATGCHRTFGSVGDFDRHRRDGRCLRPESLGLVLADGIWASLERHAKREANVARLAQHRASRGPRGTRKARTPPGGTSGQGGDAA